MLLHTEAGPRSRPAAAELEHHVDRAPRLDVVELERLVVRELLARVDQADLVDLDALLLLELPLDLQHLVGRLEGHGLLAARQRLDEDLCVGGVRLRCTRARGVYRCQCVPRVTLSLSARVLTCLRGVRSVRTYAAAGLHSFAAPRAATAVGRASQDAAGDLHAAAQPQPLRLPLSRHVRGR